MSAPVWHRRAVVYRPGTGLEGTQPLDNVCLGRYMFCSHWSNKRGNTMVHADLEADTYWNSSYHKHGVFNRVHCQFMAGLGDMGLQRISDQCLGADMSIVHIAMGAGGISGHRIG